MSANFDILIVGGGPAGISAALTAVNRGKTVGVIANPPETSKLYLAESITNYPGMEGSGAEIMQKMRSQLENSSAAIIPGKALSVMSLGKTVGVAVGNDFYEARSVIIATGISRRPLCEGETKFTDDGFVAAAQMVADMADKGYFGEGATTVDNTTAEGMLLNGQCAMLYDGSWFTSSITD